MGMAANFCVQCGSSLPTPAPNYCPSCGTAVGTSSGSPFRAFRSRWLFLVLVLAVVGSAIGGGDVGLYLLNVVLFTWVALVITRKKISVRQLVGRVPTGFNWWPVLFLAVAGIVYSIGAMPVLWYPIANLDPELVTEMFSEESEGSRFHFFVLAVILAPLLEEAVFRGLLFSRLTEKWGITRAMIVSSLAFAVLHLNPIGASIFGIVACVLYVRTRTLLVPMALHAANNFIVWALTFIEIKREIAYTSPEFVYQGLVAMLFASPVVFVLIGRWWPSRGTQLPYEANQPAQPLQG